MIIQVRDRKQIAILLLVLIVVVLMPGCSTMSIEYPEEKVVNAPMPNCVNFVEARWTMQCKVKYGLFLPSNDLHLWYEIGGVCYDSQNPNGFICDDARYKLYSDIDFSVTWQRDMMLAMRPEEAK